MAIKDGKKRFLIEDVNLTGLTEWLNEHKKKQSGKEFTTSDVQQYIRFKNIPRYMGGNEIITKRQKYTIKKYSLVANKFETIPQ